MRDTKKHVIVVGAGIVGVDRDLAAARRASGHTCGPGGSGRRYQLRQWRTSASGSIVPVTGPGLIGKGPKMLFDPEQPLFLRWSYLPKMLPWLFKYLSHANAADTKRIADALFDIIGDSVADHQALAAGTGAEKWIKPQEYMAVYADRAHYDDDAFAWSIRREHGIRFEEVEGAALHQQEAALSREITFGVRVLDHERMSDPGAYVKALAAHVVDNGGKLVRATVSDIVWQENGVATGLHIGGETISGDAVVIATGAWSGKLSKLLGLDIPLDRNAATILSSGSRR